MDSYKVIQRFSDGAFFRWPRDYDVPPGFTLFMANATFRRDPGKSLPRLRPEDLRGEPKEDTMTTDPDNARPVWADMIEGLLDHPRVVVTPAAEATLKAIVQRLRGEPVEDEALARAVPDDGYSPDAGEADEKPDPDMGIEVVATHDLGKPTLEQRVETLEEATGASTVLFDGEPMGKYRDLDPILRRVETLEHASRRNYEELIVHRRRIESLERILAAPSPCDDEPGGPR